MTAVLLLPMIYYSQATRIEKTVVYCPSMAKIEIRDATGTERSPKNIAVRNRHVFIVKIIKILSNNIFGGLHTTAILRKLIYKLFSNILCVFCNIDFSSSQI